MNTKNTQSALVAQSGAVAAESAVAKSWDGEASIPPISESPAEYLSNQRDVSQAATVPSLLLSDPSIPPSTYASSLRPITGQLKHTSSGTQTGQQKTDSLTQSVGACRSSGYPPNKLPEYTSAASDASPYFVDSTLAERAETYGEYANACAIVQTIKNVYRRRGNWGRLNESQRESLDMIASKIARILNGDPNYSDSWHDIAGYAQLIVKQLEAK